MFCKTAVVVHVKYLHCYCGVSLTFVADLVDDLHILKVAINVLN